MAVAEGTQQHAQRSHGFFVLLTGLDIGVEWQSDREPESVVAHALTDQPAAGLFAASTQRGHRRVRRSRLAPMKPLPAGRRST